LINQLTVEPLRRSTCARWVVLCSVLFHCLGVNSHAGVFAHYSFDADYTDSSGSGRHGTLTDVGAVGNSAITTAAGASVFGGGAMDFSDDRDYIALPSQTFSSGVPYTISFWAQKDDAARDWNMVIGQRDGTSFFIAPRGSSDNTIRWRSSSSAGNRQADFASVSDTAWHHYAIVADGTTISYYFDGVIVGTATNKLTGFIIDTIGEAYTSSSDFDFQGRIDEVWILDEAADAGMISGLYNKNDPGISLPVGDPSVMRLRIVLVGGQSNADGRAAPSGLPTSPVDLRAPQEDVDFFYRVEGGGATLTTLRPGLSETSGFGPEITLGRRLADLYSEEPDTRVAILKYANGGTNLDSQWRAGGDGTTAGDGPEYLTFQQTVAQGLAAFAVAYPNASLDLEGMTWVQGESDAVAGRSSSYEANLTNFIADIRATYTPDLPFHIFRLSSQQTALNAGHLATVRAAQDTVAAADPRSSLIDSDAHPMKSDNLHLNAEGQQLLGDAFARETAYYIWMLDTFSAADVDAGRAEPDADPDGDGRDNLSEFLILSDPLSATPGLDPSLDRSSSTVVTMEYNSSIYRTYAIDRYDTSSRSWMEALPLSRGTGERISRSFSFVALRGIFRVRSEIP